MNEPIPVAILIDARNIDELLPHIVDEITNQYGDLVGVDIETKDDRRHEGLNRFMKVNDEGHKSTSKKLVFDTNRTDVTGFSIYVDGSPQAYYINLMHADVENRAPWEKAKLILDAIPESKLMVAHNAPYELTMLRKSNGYPLGKNLVCSMQLAVSLFNDDTYSQDEFMQPGLGGISKLFPSVIKEFTMYDPATGSRDLTKEQSELFYKVVAKESKADHSWVGYLKTMAYGYGLKKLSKRFLGYNQMTFEEVLGGKAHMGEITGEQCCAYGADDAWVAVRLYKFLLDSMLKNNPSVVGTFFTQENPMIHVYSKVWGGGVRINLEAVRARQAIERGLVAQTLRNMKAAVRELLPFPEAKHDKLERYDPKYNTDKYRGNIVRWAATPDSEDDFTQLYQVKSSIPNQWAEEKGLPEIKVGMSINYYQQIRAFLYDLCGCSFQLYQGKIQADGEARDVMMERWIKKYEDRGTIMFDKEKKEYVQTYCEGSEQDMCDVDYKHFKLVWTVLHSYKQLAESEQVIKLFINNYLNLTDPDTGRVYPTLNSLLNSRRMALATPNLSQLPKFGGSAYVRSFFLADEPWELGADGRWHSAPPSAAPPRKVEPGFEQVVLSADWSGIELVLIGDQSKDPVFKEAYGQIPHGDVHTGTAADLMGIELTEFKARPDAKQQRNEIGKVSNFGYWYSGALGTTAKNLGWSSDQMWQAVERYRNRYPVAEAWRVGLIQSAKEWGYVTLPDHHTRIRFESTYTWANVMREKFSQYGHDAIIKFGDLVIKKIQTRSGNQAVNSEIQGTCATLAKRTAIAMDEIIEVKNYCARFMFPVHDEFVYSVQVNQLWKFMKDLWTTMCTHPDIVTTMQLDASMAIGLNYQAYHEKTNPKGQIELSELSKLPFIDESRWGKKATEEEVMLVCDYLFDRLRAPMSEAA